MILIVSKLATISWDLSIADDFGSLELLLNALGDGLKDLDVQDHQIVALSLNQGFGLEELKDAGHGLSGRIDHDGQLLVSGHHGDLGRLKVAGVDLWHHPQLGTHFLQWVGQSTDAPLLGCLSELLGKF